MKNLFIILLGIFLLSSCASSTVVSNGPIVKRKYTKGFFIKKRSGHSTSQTVHTNELEVGNERALISSNVNPEFLEPEERNTNINETISIDAVTADLDDNLNQNSNARKVPLITEYTIDNDDCDEIIERSGDIINAKVVEVGVTEIKYKKCGNETEPTYSILKSTIFMIKYADGTTDVFKEDAPKENTSTPERVRSDEPSMDVLGLSGIAVGIIAMIIGLAVSSWLVGSLLGIMPMMLGIASITTEQKNPGTWRTKNILGTISLILGALLFISIVLVFYL